MRVVQLAGGSLIHSLTGEDSTRAMESHWSWEAGPNSNAGAEMGEWKHVKIRNTEIIGN